MTATQKERRQKLYRKLQQNPKKVHLSDLIGACREPHSRQEADRLLQRGTGFQSMNSETMLDEWQMPWMFVSVLKQGLLLIAISLAAVGGSRLVFGVSVHTLEYMQLVLPPFVLPLVLLCFFWELNIPGDISVFRLLWLFVSGAFLSLMVTGILPALTSRQTNAETALWEEISKLFACIVLLTVLSLRDKIPVCGLTGLVAGAAVGAGFSAFESMDYCLERGIGVMLLRAVCALCGHVVYTAPYAAAFALHWKDGKPAWSSFLCPDFIFTFAVSSILHCLWNISRLPYVLSVPLFTAACWINVMYIVRRSLAQAVEEKELPALPQDQKKNVVLSLVGGHGCFAGKKWQSETQDELLIGRSRECSFRIPAKEGMVSRRHCRLERTAEGWEVRDLGSRHGTYLKKQEEKPQRLNPFQGYELKSGMTLYVGSRENAFKICLSPSEGGTSQSIQ